MKVLQVDNKPNGGGSELETNGGGRRRSSTNSKGSQQLSPQNIQPQPHRPHPHARSKDMSKQNIMAHQKQCKKPGVPGGKMDKEENTYQYYPSYNPHNPNVAVRPPDSPETFGWAYGGGANGCDSNHCSNCVISTPTGPQGHNGQSHNYNNPNTNSLNR